MGRYLLHREIARGGMARIHIARSIGSHGFSRLVAAKRLDPELAHDDEIVEMFLDEARVASKIRHRNVVPVLDVVSLDGEIIMVQELVHGIALHKLFRRAKDAGTRIPIEITVAIATQVLAGLHAAHEAVDETGESLCIVHRDVSPQNVMIATDGTARLLDFGVAKASRAAQCHVTSGGTFKGKVSYSSPEHLLGKATRQSDIYSLAIVLWELLVGERLHAGIDREVFVAIIEGTPPSLTEALAAEYAAFKIDDRTWAQLVALEPILRRAFARDLGERYATAADMERALQAVVAPAPLAEVAAWMKSLGQDLLDRAQQVLAAEEESWRKWRAGAGAARFADGSGVVPVAIDGDDRNATQPVRQYPRYSTSLETKSMKPSACGGSLRRASREQPEPGERTAHMRRAPLLDIVAIASVLVLLVVAVVFAAERPVQAAAPFFTLPTIAAPPASNGGTPPAAHDMFTDEGARQAAPTEAIADQPTVQPTVQPRSATRRTAKTARTPTRKADCAIPFYYEGTKKVIKRRCG